MFVHVFFRALEASRACDKGVSFQVVPKVRYVYCLVKAYLEIFRACLEIFRADLEIFKANWEIFKAYWEIF